MLSRRASKPPFSIPDPRKVPTLVQSILANPLKTSKIQNSPYLQLDLYSLAMSLEFCACLEDLQSIHKLQ